MFTLIVMFYAGFDENAVSMAKVEGFKTITACEQAAKQVEALATGVAYRKQTLCVKLEG